MRLSALCLCLLIGSSLIGETAQRPAHTASTVDSSSRFSEIRVTGSHRFQPAELVMATGLAVGDQADENTMKIGADRLASSGMFSDVVYSYVAAPQGTRVEYHVNDNPKLLPAHFDNFVWLSMSDLINELEKSEPLFRGEVPNAGEMYQRLASDLKSILAKLNVSADVSVFPEASQQGGDILGFVYKVEGVKIPIRKIDFPGASPEMSAVLEEVARGKLLGNDFSVNGLRVAGAHDLIPQYRMRGFLRAEFGTPTATLVDRANGDVAVSLPVTEGISYELAGIQWSGNSVFSATELAKVVKAPLGKPANQMQLEDDLGGISKIYGTRGYMAAHLEPRFSFDDAAKKVMVAVDVREGDQYHMGDLRIEGLNEGSAQSLRKIWKLRAGDVYDTSYPGLFLAGAARQVDMSTLKVQIMQQSKPDSKTVDVTLRFTPK